ncbi:MAG: F0F1 ATP synthase subunit epsilon [Hyphomicrobiales bacterium]|nr:F0F1 ATP synthase subunit epsilon [Hyphomicrobiales bacterium]
MAQSFAFELVSPEKLVLSEQAMQVVVPGTEGYFTVMANHAAVVAMIKPGVVEITLESGDEKRMLVRGGFADVSPDGLTLLTEYVSDLANFDLEELEQQIKNAGEDVSDAQTDEKREKAQLLLNQLEEAKAAINRSN